MDAEKYISQLFDKYDYDAMWDLFEKGGLEAGIMGIATFHSQVLNGGIYQWILNGYAKEENIRNILDTLDQFEGYSSKASRLASVVKEIVEEAGELAKELEECWDAETDTTIDNLYRFLSDKYEALEPEIEELYSKYIRFEIDPHEEDKLSDLLVAALSDYCSELEEKATNLTNKYYEIYKDFWGELQKWIENNVMRKQSAAIRRRIRRRFA